jgi:hypothetical protein
MEHERSTRRYLRREQRRRVAERCRASGLGPGDFARRHGYALSSLQRRLAEERREPPDLVFQEVALPVTTPSAAAVSWAVEIVTADGLSVRCREGLPFEDLLRLVRGRTC